VFAKKYTRSQTSGEEDQLADDLPPSTNEHDAIEAKRRQNTLAARRSRKRKLEYQREQLKGQLRAEKDEVARLRAMNERLMLSVHGDTTSTSPPLKTIAPLPPQPSTELVRALGPQQAHRTPAAFDAQVGSRSKEGAFETTDKNPLEGESSRLHSDIWEPYLNKAGTNRGNALEHQLAPKYPPATLPRFGDTPKTTVSAPPGGQAFQDSWTARTEARMKIFCEPNRAGNCLCAWHDSRRERRAYPPNMAPPGQLNCGCTAEEVLFEESLARHGVGSDDPGENGW